MIKFDKEFFDLDQTETKILNRFAENTESPPPPPSPATLSTDASKQENKSIAEKKQLILIQTPTHCSSLQANITLLLRTKYYEKKKILPINFIL